MKKVSDLVWNVVLFVGNVVYKMKEVKLVDFVRIGYNFLKEEMISIILWRKFNIFVLEDVCVCEVFFENIIVNVIVLVVKKIIGWEKRWEILKEKVRDFDDFLVM